MDWPPVEQAAISAAALIISASAAVAAAYIRSHVKGQAPTSKRSSFASWTTPL